MAAKIFLIVTAVLITEIRRRGVLQRAQMVSVGQDMGDLRQHACVPAPAV